MTKHARRMLSVAATAAGPAIAAEAPPPQPEILESEPPPVESAQARTGPFQWDFTPAFLYSLSYPNAEPQGVNDDECMPEEGTQPVVLVHGTYANQYDSFARMAPALANSGYCVYSFNYGVDGDSAIAQVPGRYGTTGLSGNADELTAFAATMRDWDCSPGPSPARRPSRPGWGRPPSTSSGVLTTSRTWAPRATPSPASTTPSSGRGTTR